MAIPKPPYEPAFASFLAAYAKVAPADILPEHIPPFRAGQAAASTAESVLGPDVPFTLEDRSIKTPNGDILLAIFYPKTPAPSPRPCVIYMHGGGMVFGTRFTGARDPLLCAAAADAVLISVEYRLAPEHPFPAPLDDCWNALKWTAENAAYIGVDPERIMLAGQSAGGNLAAATALVARDRGGPKVCAQLLDCPMLDDRMTTVSSKQFISEGTWSRESSRTAWKAYLGHEPGEPGVSAYAAPGRVADIKGLPTTFIGVGGAELFRDESIEYARRLWAEGTAVELHVWPGAFHCFDMLMPEHALSKASLQARIDWTKKVLGVEPVPAKL